jgi:hypothetical protein
MRSNRFETYAFTSKINFSICHPRQQIGDPATRFSDTKFWIPARLQRLHFGQASAGMTLEMSNL